MKINISNYKDYQKALQKAQDAILSGKIIIYPTDTLYGLGCDGLNKRVVGRIYEIKKIKKQEQKPMSAMFGHIEIIKEYCEMEEWQEKILKKYLPGPFTFLLKLKKMIPLTNTDILGVRIPDNKFCIDLSKLCKIPIASTSANLTGQKPPTSVGEIDKEVLEKVDLIINKGPCKFKEASTVVDLTGADGKKIKILRQGSGEFVD